VHHFSSLPTECTMICLLIRAKAESSGSLNNCYHENAFLRIAKGLESFKIAAPQQRDFAVYVEKPFLERTAKFVWQKPNAVANPGPSRRHMIPRGEFSPPPGSSRDPGGAGVSSSVLPFRGPGVPPASHCLRRGGVAAPGVSVTRCGPKSHNVGGAAVSIAERSLETFFIASHLVGRRKVRNRGGRGLLRGGVKVKRRAYSPLVKHLDEPPV